MLHIKHFQISDIKSPFWRGIIQDMADRHGKRIAVEFYYEVYMRSKEIIKKQGKIPYIAKAPLRKSNERAYLAGETMLSLCPRQLRNIKKEAECSTGLQNLP